MKNRSRLDILANILEAANDGGEITLAKIMYKTYTSYEQVRSVHIPTNLEISHIGELKKND